MDGNLYLIKLVKKHPVLWDKNYLENRDPETRNAAWTEIAGIIGTEVNWIRSRWYNLRERFVKELKHAYNEKQECSFKYFKEMLFLLKYVEFRKKPDAQFDKFVKQLPKNESSSKSSESLENDNACEFIITQKEIEESDNEDSDTIFVELTESNDETIYDVSNDVKADDGTLIVAGSQCNLQQICDSTGPEEMSSCIKIDSMVDDGKIIKTEPCNGLTTVTVDIEQAEKFNSNCKDVKEINKNVSPQLESRCEDTIFGELVTAMLKKMNESKKKQTKKEIMNILLS